MSAKIRWKFLLLIASSLTCFGLLQWGLISMGQKPFLPMTFLTLLGIILLTFFIHQRWMQSIEARFTKTIDTLQAEWNQTLKRVSREKEDCLRMMQEMSEGILILDERGRIRWVNEALRTLFAFPEEATGKSPLELIRHSELEEALKEALKTGKRSSFEMTLPSSPQKIFEANIIPMSSSPGMDAEGTEVSGAIAVFHDISRLKELERMRQDFVANVSHELRTPLTTIKGYTETLLDGALHEEVAFSFIQIIQKHTDRLTKLVEDLLTISKIESRELRLNLEPLNLSEVLRDVLEFIQEAAQKKRVSLQKDVSIESIWVKADRFYLEQILLNLLDNAIKYNREGGEIKVSAQLKDQGVEVSIQDSGIGIPSEDLPRLFERFYRVDKGRSKELGGTGLGLAIVKHLVQAHGGRIWAKSQLGEGSTFFFTLPRSL